MLSATFRQGFPKGRGRLPERLRLVDRPHSFGRPLAMRAGRARDRGLQRLAGAPSLKEVRAGKVGQTWRGVVSRSVWPKGSRSTAALSCGMGRKIGDDRSLSRDWAPAQPTLRMANAVTAEWMGHGKREYEATAQSLQRMSQCGQRTAFQWHGRLPSQIVVCIHTCPTYDHPPNLR